MSFQARERNVPALDRLKPEFVGKIFIFNLLEPVFFTLIEKKAAFLGEPFPRGSRVFLPSRGSRF